MNSIIDNNIQYLKQYITHLLVL